MNIVRKSWFVGLVGILIAPAAFGQAATPSAIPQQQPPKANAPQAAPDESSQNIWDDDVARVSRELAKLRSRLRVKESESRALEAYGKGDYNKVRELVPEILKMDPEAVGPGEYLASAAFMTGDKTAVEKFDAAIERRKKWLESHASPEEQRDGVKHLSVLYGNRGVARLRDDPRGALADFDEALNSRTPLKAMITWEKSEALAALHRYEEAAKLFAAAVDMDPDLKARGNVKFPDPTARNLCQVLAANGQKISACN